MQEVVIKLDYSYGPIWQNKYDAATGGWSTGIKVIDEDAALWVLNDSAEGLYTSLYTFDKEQNCVFDEERYETIRPSLLSIIQTIILRLNEINDGSYCVKDEETEHLLKKAS